MPKGVIIVNAPYGAASAPEVVDVVALGESMVTFLPTRPGRLADVPSFDRAIGGAESNVACVLASAGHTARWVSRVGADGFGDHLVAEIGSYGVDTGHVVRDPARPTGVYFRTAGDRADGTHEVAYYRAGSAASAMSPATVDLRAVRAARILHLTGITAALSPECRALLTDLTSPAPGRPLISFDINYRPALWPTPSDTALLLTLARRADIVFIGEDEAEQAWGVGGGPAEIRSLLPEPLLLVVKQGARGATAYITDPPAPLPAPASPHPDAPAASPASPSADALAASPASPSADALAASPASPSADALAASPASPHPDALATSPASPRADALAASPASPRADAHGAPPRRRSAGSRASPSALIAWGDPQAARVGADGTSPAPSGATDSRPTLTESTALSGATHPRPTLTESTAPSGATHPRPTLTESTAPGGATHPRPTPTESTAPGGATHPRPAAQPATFVSAPEVTVVAAPGAGDAFAAGVLSGTLRGLPLPTRLRLGHLYAAAALTTPGDLAAPPARAHADRLTALDTPAWERLRLGPGWTQADPPTPRPAAPEEARTP